MQINPKNTNKITIFEKKIYQKQKNRNQELVELVIFKISSKISEITPLFGLNFSKTN